MLLMIHCSEKSLLEMKIPLKNAFSHVPFRGEENQERKRRVNETFVFKQERQDVGVIVISLNSSIHPRVLVIFVQQSVRSRQEV